MMLQQPSRNSNIAAAAVLILAAVPVFFVHFYAIFIALAAMVLILLALVIARPWRRAIGSTEFALYWLVLALVLAVAGSVMIAEDIMILHRTKMIANPGLPRPPQPETNALVAGWGICAGYVTASALVLGWIRRRVIGATEIGLYWLGSVIAISVALFWLTTAKAWKPVEPASGQDYAVLITAVFALAAGLFVSLLRGRALGGTELMIYWLASALSLGLGAAVLLRIDNALFAVICVLGAVIVTIPLWYIANNRRTIGA